MHYSPAYYKKQCNHIWIVNLQNSIWWTPRLCSMMLNPVGFSLSLLLLHLSLSIPLPCLYLTVHSLCFHLFFCFFPSLPLLSSFWPVSFLWAPGELVAWWFCAPWPTCALWPSADVAHHRPQHALNKPSNSKAPQGTSLSATLTLLPYGCQPSSTHCQHSLRPLTEL